MARSNVVKFEFENSNDSGFEETIAEGGFYKTSEFWNHNLVRQNQTTA